mgnify:FL=1
MGRSKRSYKRAHQTQAARTLNCDLVNDAYDYKSQIQTLEEKVELLTLQNKALLSVIRRFKPNTK